jgi:hypothetical protein
VNPVAVKREKAAALLDMSPEFFDVHVRPHVRCVYLGGRPTRFWRVATLEQFMAEREGEELAGLRAVS